MIDGHLLPFGRIYRSGTNIAGPQIMTSLVSEMPRFQRILCRITQLSDGRPDALTQLQIKPDRSHAVFVRVHELPPGSPSFRPQLLASHSKLPTLAQFTDDPGALRTSQAFLQRIT